jgi:hypothetical protein
MSAGSGTVEPMLYRLLADLVVAVHLGYLAFVGGGALLAWRWRRLVGPHLAALAAAATSVGVGFDCPLTHVEKWLRRLGGEHPYRGGFIDHYVAGTLSPGEDRLAQLVVAAVVIGVYGTLAVRHRRTRRGVSRPAAPEAA